MRKRKSLFVVSLVFIAICSWELYSRKEFEKKSLKLNYEVIADGAPALIHPATSERAQLFVFLQLPPDCWQKSKWLEGETGRISIYKGSCRVEPNVKWTQYNVSKRLEY